MFSSSLAVFGGDLPEIIQDSTAVTPQSTYGAQKAMSELLINDYTRKGFVDGLCVRLPTICIRPRKPNKAASSFVSSIIREPLHGETSICPVAEKMAFSFIKFLGKKKEEWALAITGYVVSIPIVLPILLIFIKAILDLGK
ncbi:TPA: NAD-dependent epimerase/dehydratase family protein [Haemophilus influenzae]|uniref:GntT/GntP/DsdX family permease n=1 Tax=Haemophilus influenzae TaxID=727 RepID=UPI0009AF036C